MKPQILPFLSFPILALAHAKGHHHHRQVTSGTTSGASSTSTTSTPLGSATNSGSSTTLSGSLLPTTTGYTPSFSLLSENPTAVPLASIVVNAPSPAISPTPPPYPPGTKPSNIPNAPGLPDISRLSPANYPHLDTPPPTDSPEVLAWIQQVENSGVQIPNLTTTVAGGCSANPQAAADTSRCWWTCGGCTSPNDVVNCPVKNQWGLTYDDGPAPYTSDILTYLGQVDLLATLFVVGSRVISTPSVVQKEYLAGHQIAVHTWSHYSLTTLTNEQIIAELGWSKKVIYDVLGVTPTAMRPPFGDIDNRVRAICTAMNLTPVIWTRINTTATFDTDDYNIHGGTTNVQQVLFNWENIMQNVVNMNNGFIVLEHDLFQQSVEVATGYILPDALARQPKLNITTVNSCLNRPPGDAYLETNDNSTNPLPLSSFGNSTNSSSGSGSSKHNGAGAVARTDALVVVAVAVMLGAMVFTF